MEATTKENVLNAIDDMQKHIEFDDLLHKYWFDGKEVISVTQLLKKHGLSPNYSRVNEDTLKRASDRGTAIHKDIELFINDKIEPKMEESDEYFKLLKQGDFEPLKAEFFVGNDLVCGECDAILFREPFVYIDDHKTGTVIHKEAVRWQGSIYAYLLGIYNSVHYIICSHLPKNIDKCELVYLEKIPLENIEKLFECEKRGELYCDNDKQVSLPDIPELEELKNVEQYIFDMETAIKDVKQKQQELRALILKNMQDNDIWSFDFGNVHITRKKGSVRTTINMTKLKADMPEIAEKYKQETPVAESLLVKLGGE